MKILLAGGSGLVGSALHSHLQNDGHHVCRLVRRETGSEDEIRWNPDAGQLRPEAIERFDAMVHLGGESIASGRWTQGKMDRIRSSRIDSTRLLAETIAKLADPPRVFACASAIGYYGDRGDELLDEDSPPRSDEDEAAAAQFLPHVCRKWEEAAEAARGDATRVVNLRFGIVLSRQGGALRQMLPLFRLGLGGRIGSGKQYWSWITLDDAVAAIAHALEKPSLDGPLNLTAPAPVTNREFTATLARHLRRPALAPAPAMVLRATLGRMADELLLASTRVVPKRLLETGFTFEYTELEPALDHLLHN